VADIANDIWVWAGAAKAGETTPVTMARIRHVFAQNLPTKEHTEG
jgi:hypothetical protein